MEDGRAAELCGPVVNGTRAGTPAELGPPAVTYIVDSHMQRLLITTCYKTFRNAHVCVFVCMYIHAHVHTLTSGDRRARENMKETNKSLASGTS